MLNKTNTTLILLIILMSLSAFSRQASIVLKDVEINVLKTAGILRYDMILKKTNELKLETSETGDSPGHHMFQNGTNLN